MLKLTNIVKEYPGATTVRALKGVSIAFRSSEFVAILGHSGCGKTTLLNIIGGLDRYTSGDLIIRDRSTKEYKSRDWDTYRNHSVGFVFQSYNLIPHQSVLANVELALTLSGIRRKERRRRAAEALEKVGLGDQLHKKPNQLSGGQMQRVAIARALVNDPEILLADEPTGALDSDTSVQIMELLKEVAKDRLVIMVTHNPELADTYATRIVRLTDGLITSDSDPYEGEEKMPASTTAKGKRASMSGLTAFMLSLSNLMTKKGRTIMTAFAGSIGIIGIALILSISTGVNNYIEGVERDTLSNYPLTLQSSTMDMTSMMLAMQENREDIAFDDNTIYSANVMSGMMDMMFEGATENDLAAFKQFIESGESDLEALTSEIRYLYSTPLNIYKADTSKGIYQVNPSNIFAQMGMQGGQSMMNTDVFLHMTDNPELMETQFQLLAGDYPKAWNEVVLIVDEQNRVTDYTLYTLGVLDIDVLKQALADKMAGKETDIDTTTRTYSFTDFIGMQFKILPSSANYQETDGIWVDKSEDTLYMTTALQSAEAITVVGVLRPTGEASTGMASGVIGYRGDLMQHMIQAVAASEVVKAQQETPDTDVLTGLPFGSGDANIVIYSMAEIQAMLPTLPQEQQAELGGAIMQMQGTGMPEDQICEAISKALQPGFSPSTYDANLELLGVSDPEKPSAINLYPVDFEAKDAIADIIADYNAGRPEESQITYTDYVGLMMSSITTIINAISYILIAFVAISLVVSSIMIGIITNISVLERTKEIGILRAVGASKKDISHVFNAETMIVGLAAGLVGISMTQLLIIPINLLIQNVAKLDASAYLHPVAAVILVVISVLLTAVAGLIPARNAANKDPVVALRTE
jgi:putative ABC transport system permease protein